MADRHKAPTLEWIAAAIGLLVTLAMFAVIGHDAIAGSGGRPMLAATAGETCRTHAGHAVAFTVANDSPAAAASVAVEGVLALPGRAPETSSATLDYVAGRSEARGAMIFAADPASGALTLRVRAYTEP